MTKERYPASNLCVAALRSVENQLKFFNHRNIGTFETPFENIGGEFKNNTFHVISYDWDLADEGKDQEYNFEWKSVKFWWYKYLGRSMECNKKLTNEEIEQMLEECLESLRIKRKNKC
jgi:hypothetical protein